MVEYEGLLLALRKVRAVGARRLVILTDSELVAGHIGKTYKAKKPDMMKYLQALRSMEKFFLGVTVKSFPQLYNNEADAIAKARALHEPLPLDVFYETTTVRSAADKVAPPKFVNAIHSEDWRTPKVAAIKGYYESEDGVVDKRVAIRARNYHTLMTTCAERECVLHCSNAYQQPKASNCSTRYTAACARITLVQEP
jgi:hypothetical protein